MRLESTQSSLSRGDHACAPDEWRPAFARPLASAREAVAARRLQRTWRGTDQVAAAAEDEALRTRNAEAAAAGRPLEYVFRSLYLPEQGMICQLPADLQLGMRLPVRGHPFCTALTCFLCGRSSSCLPAASAGAFLSYIWA